MLRSLLWVIAAALFVGAAPACRAALPAPIAGVAEAGITAKEAEHAFEARYRHAATLKAIFYQRYSDGKGAGEAESGTVYFSRPGRMRWEYESPEKKLFIVDGKNVWFYIPDDHTASRAKLKESSDWRTPLALLAGKPDLGRICKNCRTRRSRQNPTCRAVAAAKRRAGGFGRCHPALHAARKLGSDG